MANTQYAVVKHAGGTWEHYWKEDPKKGVCQCSSAHASHTGKEAQLQPVYDKESNADVAAQGANILNPVGDYAACPIINKGCSICPMPDESTSEIEVARAEFEAWYVTQKRDQVAIWHPAGTLFDSVNYPNGRYTRMTEKQSAWEVWQAAKGISTC